jgi:hypothetical protein
MTRKKKPAPRIELADGRMGVAPFATLYWFDGRIKRPSPWARGYPRSENGSIEGAAREVMTGRAYRVQCFNRVKGRAEWTVERGERQPGTHLYQPIITRGGTVHGGKK